jgi:hypothetical protein
MLKLIAIVYMTSNINTSVNMDYCEIKDLQSPYVKKIDDHDKVNEPYAPIDTCDLNNVKESDKEKALLECIKLRQNWYKL